MGLDWKHLIASLVITTLAVVLAEKVIIPMLPAGK